MLIQSKARLRYVSIPPKKMRLVGELVKGMAVEKALGILNFTPRIAAHHMARTLKSAAANALSKEGTDRLKPESLVIKSITVDAAPTAKRIRFQSMGRVFRYRKRFCHLTILIEGKLDAAEQPRKPGKRKRAAEKTKDDSGAKAAKTKSGTTSKTKSTAKDRPRAKKDAPATKVQTKPKVTSKAGAKAQGDRG